MEIFTAPKVVFEVGINVTLPENHFLATLIYDEANIYAKT